MFLHVLHARQSLTNVICVTHKHSPIESRWGNFCIQFHWVQFGCQFQFNLLLFHCNCSVQLIAMNNAVRVISNSNSIYIRAGSEFDLFNFHISHVITLAASITMWQCALLKLNGRFTVLAANPISSHSIQFHFGFTPFKKYWFEEF